MRPRTLFVLVVVSLLYAALNLVKFFGPPPLGWGLFLDVRPPSRPANIGRLFFEPALEPIPVVAPAPPGLCRGTSWEESQEIAGRALAGPGYQYSTVR